MILFNKRKMLDAPSAFKHEAPTIKRKKDAKKYMKEMYQYNSTLNGTGNLGDYLKDYKGWLVYLDNEKNRILDEEEVPSETYFFVRCNDNKVIGMTNIRTALNEKYRNGIGNIGYSIRPTERQKGYNKINLYLALKRCDELGMKNVMMECDKRNVASARTILALGGVLVKERENNVLNRIEQVYDIDVKKSLEEYADKYEPYIKIE